MPIKYIPTKLDDSSNPITSQIIKEITQKTLFSAADEGVLYYGWPRFTDYDSIKHFADLTLVSAKRGLVLIRVLHSDEERLISDEKQSILQVAASAIGLLIKSSLLRKRTALFFDVIPVIYASGVADNPEAEVPTFGSLQNLFRFLEAIEDQEIPNNALDEIQSILEGPKALGAPTKRSIKNPSTEKIANSLKKLEEEIAKFDTKQRQVALTAIAGPQRIRGLAGSGKTVILAMKAAITHLDNPDAKILVTYYTRSLHDSLRRMITKFVRHFGDGEPNWENIHVYHGWGRQNVPGTYRTAALRAGLSPMDFGSAQRNARGGESGFSYVCRHLVASERIEPYYDITLIDEGQDFPPSFYQLCFYLTKGERDAKQIIWAYDELQDVFDVRVRTPEELFGTDTDGKPRISLSRSCPQEMETNDFVLPKCYRNQRNTLVLAHAVGFGLYGTPVQMLQNQKHWEDVGYELLRGNLNQGSSVVITRPQKNSPTTLDTPDDTPLIEVKGFNEVGHEVEYCVTEIQKFISEGGLLPEDIMVISVDDRVARDYLNITAQKLSDIGYKTNNIIADRYSEPPFKIEGKITLSTVYRAKGNEAAVVFVLGCDAVSLESRTGRNRLFTAFTRTKGWLRITGFGSRFSALEKEILSALSDTPEMKFIMPDINKIDLIQRDLSEKDARLQRAESEMQRIKESLNLSDEDMKNIFAKKDKLK
ncbi:DEAD/DEAH box helicase [Gluconobacter albidus]|uniref:DNA 3'-5' helicase II n=1 Tax=Gluconobacter albidus TaxID=318683 RepID=A0ABQ5X4J5_9PROT|nr:ATP-binding domain-containing protein [Gluconobacter albidus]GBQ87736.1 superfamily I DNA/RNA helicase [Gluconobacter albidus NBRC 3250]GLQ70179.1 hypothetical protein GCM10007866_26320 [Gluconobacter albidus]